MKVNQSIKRTPAQEDEDMMDLTPTIEIGDEKLGIRATYYSDLSGEIFIVNDDAEEIFFKDDGKLNHHIEYLEEGIADLEKSHKKNIKRFKTAIVLLKKHLPKKQSKTKVKLNGKR